MGAKLDGTKGKVRLTGGQAPRLAGLMLDGPAQVSTSGARKIIDRYDLLKEHDLAANGTSNTASGARRPKHDVLDTLEDDLAQHPAYDAAWENEPIEDD